MGQRDFDHPAFREMTVGTGGVGKTTAFIERLKKQKASVVWIFDHKHEFCRKLNSPAIYSIPELCRATAKGGYVCFDPCRLWPDDKIAAFRFFCDFVYGVSAEIPGRKILVADEIHRLTEKSKRPRELLLCVDDGRCFRLDCMFVGQASNSMHNEFRNQITELYTFRQADKNAVVFLEDNGFDPDEVRALRPGEWLWRNFNTGQAARGGKAFEIKSPSTRNAGVARSRADAQGRGGKNANQRVGRPATPRKNLPADTKTNDARGRVPSAAQSASERSDINQR
jgi:hypothetical protein